MSRLARWLSFHRHFVTLPAGAKGASVPFISNPVPTFQSRPSGFVAPVLNGCNKRHWQSSRGYSTSETRGRKPSRYIQTLDPAKLHSADQKILTLSGMCEVHSNLNEHLASVLGPFERPTLRVSFQNPLTTPFPPETEGVFYYDSSQAQIRFRLCKTLEDFKIGPDLRCTDSSTWNISLAKMARNTSRYGAFLALVKHEFPVKSQDVDFAHDMRRSVSTFSPQRLVEMDQRVFDISGYHLVSISPQGRATACLGYVKHDRAKRHPFPDNTIGAFYCRQSKTSPTRIGELRFRICSDVAAFDMGSDLLLPSGQPWCISSHSLQTAKHLQSLREHLVGEGLLDRDVYLVVPDAVRAPSATPLTSFRQPFVVDLSSSSFALSLISPGVEASPYSLSLSGVFRKSPNYKEPLFSGRAVVCLEQYPNPHPRNPVLVIRVLELLTPMKRLSASNVILDPTPGELLMRRYRGQYIPYGYSPLKADTRATIAAWIHAHQSE